MKIRKDVLLLWQAQHGKLKLPLMNAFLEKEESYRIGLYPKQWIKSAFSHTRKLDEALEILRWRSAIEPNSQRIDSGQSTAENLAQKTPDKKPTGAAADDFSQVIYPEISVVGESFYRENFNLVRELLAAPEKSKHEASFALARDPGNPFSKSGKAVRVQFDSLTLGFVREAIAPAIFSMVERLEHPAHVAGTIWFDSAKARKPRNSVRIHAAGIYEQLKPTPPNSALKKDSNYSQAEQDAAAWRAKHPNSKPLEPVWYNGTKGRVNRGQKKVKKANTPFKMHFYCSKCHMNAGSRARPCVNCGTLMRLPRPAAKSLAASKARWEDERAKRKLQQLEQRREQAKRNNRRS